MASRDVIDDTKSHLQCLDPQVGHESPTHLDVSFDVSGAPLLALDVDLDEIVSLKMSFKAFEVIVALEEG